MEYLTDHAASRITPYGRPDLPGRLAIARLNPIKATLIPSVILRPEPKNLVIVGIIQTIRKETLRHTHGDK